MGGRSSSSGMSTRASGSSAERSIAVSLNNGDWESAERKLSRVKAGSEVSVGVDTFVKRREAGWRGTDSRGYPKTFSTSEMAQEVAARTYTGLRAKVKLKK